MKLEIYNDPTLEPEKVVRLRLVKHLNGIELIAVNERGLNAGAGAILKLSSGGRIYRYPAVSTTLGFDLDVDSRVKTN